MLVYTTLNHVKYCLPNGDSGIIRTLDVPVYITKVSNQILFALDREGKNRQIQVLLVIEIMAYWYCSADINDLVKV